jgi:hypothetical protein
MILSVGCSFEIVEINSNDVKSPTNFTTSLQSDIYIAIILHLSCQLLNNVPFDSKCQVSISRGW